MRFGERSLADTSLRGLCRAALGAGRFEARSQSFSQNMRTKSTRRDHSLIYAALIAKVPSPRCPGGPWGPSPPAAVKRAHSQTFGAFPPSAAEGPPLIESGPGPAGKITAANDGDP